MSSDKNPTKPNPDAVKKLCKALGLKPTDCALIGDSDTDLKMARQAGIKSAIGYISGWKIKPKLSYQQELISNWKDLTCT